VTARQTTTFSQNIQIHASHSWRTSQSLDGPL
jgi:hypothetical protein